MSALEQLREGGNKEEGKLGKRIEKKEGEGK
jgi:hypothetical protein